MNTLNLYEHPAAKHHTINLSRYARTRMALTFAWMRLGLGLVGEDAGDWQRRDQIS